MTLTKSRVKAPTFLYSLSMSTAQSPTHHIKMPSYHQY